MFPVANEKAKKDALDCRTSIAILKRGFFGSYPARGPRTSNSDHKNSVKGINKEAAVKRLIRDVKDTLRPTAELREDSQALVDSVFVS
jgi:hypothetical protein